jgi:hypothetical protein
LTVKSFSAIEYAIKLLFYFIYQEAEERVRGGACSGAEAEALCRGRRFGADRKASSLRSASLRGLQGTQQNPVQALQGTVTCFFLFLLVKVGHCTSSATL